MAKICGKKNSVGTGAGDGVGVAGKVLPHPKTGLQVLVQSWRVPAKAPHPSCRPSPRSYLLRDQRASISVL